eukprot:350961-Chlamydomonas_euryale.AAC.1
MVTPDCMSLHLQFRHRHPQLRLQHRQTAVPRHEQHRDGVAARLRNEALNVHVHRVRQPRHKQRQQQRAAASAVQRLVVPQQYRHVAHVRGAVVAHCQQQLQGTVREGVKGKWGGAAFSSWGTGVEEQLFAAKRERGRVHGWVGRGFRSRCGRQREGVGWGKEQGAEVPAAAAVAEQSRVHAPHPEPGAQARDREVHAEVRCAGERRGALPIGQHAHVRACRVEPQPREVALEHPVHVSAVLALALRLLHVQARLLGDLKGWAWGWGAGRVGVGEDMGAVLALAQRLLHVQVRLLGDLNEGGWKEGERGRERLGTGRMWAQCSRSRSACSTYRRVFLGI